MEYNGRIKNAFIASLFPKFWDALRGGFYNKMCCIVDGVINILDTGANAMISAKDFFTNCRVEESKEIVL